GEPKAAVLRHRHLASYVISTVEFMGADEDHAALVSVPPYHVAGMATILTSVYGGRRLVYLPQFDPQRWVDVVCDEGITHAMVVPTMLGRILDAVEAPGGEAPQPPASGLRRWPDADPGAGTGNGSAAGGGVRQRLRPHGDGVDGRHARAGGPPGRPRERRPCHPG